MKNRTEKKHTAVIWLSVIALMWITHTLTKNFVSDPAFAKLIALKESFTADRSLWLFMLRAHILLAIVSLVTGPIGAIRKIRQQSPALHRWNGRIYIVSILLNFIPGLYVSWFAAGGLTVAGFLVLNILWLGTTWLGYVYIRRKDVVRHSQWILRSFFLTFANLTIHLLLPIGQHALGLSYVSAYALAVWGSMLLNGGLAEIAIRKKWLI
ncbi:Predicted membrane protein [Paenibacillus sp. UNCCL117]|uniref:DUF2306 domain-containing protein n=1 Tax=unclassified Paenibacillus TaxID=185978 RepID=UPI00088E429B|nr:MULTISPECIES: DUF2306 domain-containing protein [unclassified Paenibacillus]SDD65693.1 Predicted membrane protein [Paenibacillus sp. cl123]SFW58074.1 Predicted membrane protein [Paenibacillus sp. UNCCL117]